jgi:uncharacterized protein YuzE
MRVTADHSVGAGYIYLATINKGDAVEQVHVPSKHIILDFNKAGQLLGIEFLSLANMPPREEAGS